VSTVSLIDKLHWNCFEPNYQISWQRRGGKSTFNEDGYGACMNRSLEHEISAISAGSAKAALEAQLAQREASERNRETRAAALAATRAAQAAAATPTPTPPEVVTVSGLVIKPLDRSTRTLSASFAVAGAFTSKFMCRYSLACGPDSRVASEGTLSCLAPLDRVHAEATLRISLTKDPVPPCVLTVDLTDGAAGYSNPVIGTVPQ
jgi:hypothetical protein